MELQVKCENRCVRIYLRGELDHHAAKELMARLQREMEILLPLQLTLDFEGVSFMDSSGIAVVVRAARWMKESGGTIKLSRIPVQAKKVFDAAGVSRMMEMEERRRSDESGELRSRGVLQPQLQ